MTDIPSQYEVIIYQQSDDTSSWGTQAANEKSPGVTVIRAWMPENFSYSVTSEYDAPFQKIVNNDLVENLASMFGQKLVTPAMTAQLWQGSTHPEFSIELTFETESDPLKDVREPILKLLRLATPKLNEMQLLESPGPQLDTTQLTNIATTTTATLASGLANIGRNGGSILQSLGLIGDATNAAISDALGKIDPKAQGSLGKTTNTEDSATNVAHNSNTDNTVVNDMVGRGGRSQVKNQIAISIGRYIYFPSVVITNVECEFLHQIELGTGFPMSATVTVGFKPMFIPTQSDLNTMFGA